MSRRGAWSAAALWFRTFPKARQQQQEGETVTAKTRRAEFVVPLWFFFSFLFCHRSFCFGWDPNSCVAVAVMLKLSRVNRWQKPPRLTTRACPRAHSSVLHIRCVESMNSLPRCEAKVHKSHIRLCACVHASWLITQGGERQAARLDATPQAARLASSSPDQLAEGPFWVLVRVARGAATAGWLKDCAVWRAADWVEQGRRHQSYIKVCLFFFPQEAWRSSSFSGNEKKNKHFKIK